MQTYKKRPNVCPDEKCLFREWEKFMQPAPFMHPMFPSYKLSLRQITNCWCRHGPHLIAPCITHYLVQIITFKQLDMLQMVHRETVRHPTLTAPRCTLQVKHYTDPWWPSSERAHVGSWELLHIKHTQPRAADKSLVLKHDPPVWLQQVQ